MCPLCCCPLFSSYRLSFLRALDPVSFWAFLVRRPNIWALVEPPRTVRFCSAYSTARGTLRLSRHLYSLSQISSQLIGLEIVIRWTLWRDEIHLLQYSRLSILGFIVSPPSSAAGFSFLTVITVQFLPLLGGSTLCSQKFSLSFFFKFHAYMIQRRSNYVMIFIYASLVMLLASILLY